MEKDWLDKRICDKEGGDSIQTFREYIIESEMHFGFNYINHNVLME